VTKGTSWRPFFIVIAALFIVIADLFIVIASPFLPVIASRRRGNLRKSKTQKSKGKMTEQSLEM